MTTTIISPGSDAAVSAGGLLPGQVHALRAAARFIQQAGLGGLRVTVGSDGSVCIIIEVQAGSADARIAAAAALAARAGAPGLERADQGTWELAHTARPGWLEGHDVRVATYLAKDPAAGGLS